MLQVIGSSRSMVAYHQGGSSIFQSIAKWRQLEFLESEKLILHNLRVCLKEQILAMKGPTMLDIIVGHFLPVSLKGAIRKVEGADGQQIKSGVH
jgi:hypothetical protein